jgi:3-oxoacyl-[acyl-carrier protein] reductase
VGRFGQPEEVAQVVELLITNSYMTDKVREPCIELFLLVTVYDLQIVTCDGGMIPSSLA